MSVKLRNWIEPQGGDGYLQKTTWWDNFSRAHHYISPTWADEDNFVEWGATYHNDGLFDCWIEFENEEDATLFLLRWS